MTGIAAVRFVCAAIHHEATKDTKDTKKSRDVWVCTPPLLLFFVSFVSFVPFVSFVSFV